MAERQDNNIYLFVYSMFNEREMHQLKLLLPIPAFYQVNYINQLKFCVNERFLKDRLQLQLSFVQVVHFC